MTALIKSLEAKRARLNEDEKGFTLIELLVVVIIIGILAAIAIPIFLGQQDQAKDAGVKSDLALAKTAVISWLTDNPTGAPPALSDAAYGDYGYSVSDNTDSIAFGTTAPTRDTFCIQGMRVGGTAASDTFRITESAGAEKGSCP